MSVKNNEIEKEIMDIAKLSIHQGDYLSAINDFITNNEARTQIINKLGEISEICVNEIMKK